MKFNSSVTLTLILLSFMFAIGIVSGIAGYAFGRKALQGITQPAISPILGGSGNLSKLPNFLKERDILASVEAQTNGVAKNSEDQASESKSSNQQAGEKARKAAKASASKKDTVAKVFPIRSQAQGVTLEVRSLSHQDDGILLDVALKNEGSKPVQFLYTFLDVTDDQGRDLTAVTKGLPTQVQPNGETFSGSIKIPQADLENTKQLSLSLTDYPNQDLRLNLSHIPVAK
jgi:hypothetical protein